MLGFCSSIPEKPQRGRSEGQVGSHTVPPQTTVPTLRGGGGGECSETKTKRRQSNTAVSVRECIDPHLVIFC